MTKIFPIFLIIFLIFVKNFALNLQSSTVFCGNSAVNYSLNPGDGLFFESPSYPLSINNDNKNNSVQCLANFMTNAVDLLFFFTNGKIGNFQLGLATEVLGQKPTGSCQNCWNYNSNIDKILVLRIQSQSQISFVYDSGRDFFEWSGFQSFVFAPKRTMINDCFLDHNIFNLTNVNQIIPLYANGNQSLNVFDVCQWNFVVPSNFKLKIVVTSLFGKELTIKTADYQGQIIKPGVYYFDNPTIEIYYRKYLNMTYGLQGYVTLVSRSNSTTTTNCHQTTNGNVVIYSNSANNQGYENNWACSTNLQNIQANKRYLFTVTKPFYENLGDQLRLNDPTAQNGTYCFSYDSPMVFDSSFKTDLQLEFISDGSVVQNGFEVQQVEQNCSCPVVELMSNCNSSLASYIFAGYCINVNCTYTLKINPACPDKLISLYITSKLTTKPIYIFVITIGQSSPNYIIGTGKYDYLSYLPTTKINFQLASNPIMISPYFFPYISVEISTDEPPKFSKVELTADSPLFVLDLKTDSNNYNISVPVGQTLEIILTSTEDADYYDLYDGTEYFGGFYRVVITSDDKQLPRYTSKHGYMIVFNKYQDFGYSSNMVVIFRNVEIHSKNCDTRDNLLKMPELNGNLKMANGLSSPCMWTILKYNYDGTDPSYLITELTTTIEDEITVIPNVDSKHPIFSFSNSDESKWNAIVLTNVVNTIILPNSGQLTMNLKKLNSNFLDFGSNPPKNITGIVYSSSYANPNAPLMNGTTLMNIQYTTDESVFICKALDLGIGDVVAINEIPVIHVGQNITIKNAAEIAVTFTSKTLGKRGFLLEYSSKINQTNFNPNSKSVPRFALNFFIFTFLIFCF